MSVAFVENWRDRMDTPPLVRVLEIRDKQDASKILHRLLIVREEVRGEMGATLALSYIELDVRYGGMNNHRFRGEYEKWPDGTERVSVTGGGVMVTPAHLRGFHLGTYLQDEVICWARQWPRAAVRQISLSPVDSQVDNCERRNRFYEQFGIEFDYANDRKSGISRPMLASALRPVGAATWQRDITEHGLVGFIRDQAEKVESLLRTNDRLSTREKNVSKLLDEAQKRISKLKVGLAVGGVVGILWWFLLSN